jgi:hypothetical protein
MTANAKVKLIDLPDEAGPTTANLFSSLAARLIALHYTSGVSVVGSTLSGLAEIGAEISKTAEGARMRRAIADSAAHANGEIIWNVLCIGNWTNGMPASPVLDHVRNDLALLVARDLNEVIKNVPPPQETRLGHTVSTRRNLTFLDTLLGLWAYSREIVMSIETLAKQTSDVTAEMERGEGLGDGELLR